jgi:hypothetical protein
MLSRLSSHIQVPKTLSIVKDSDNIAQSEAFMVVSWLKSRPGPLFTSGPGGNRSYNYNGFVEAVYWTFDGNFQKNTTVIMIDKLPSPATLFKINELAVYPMNFVDETVQHAIRARGEMFWKCRRQHYVCYTDRSVDGFQKAVWLLNQAPVIAH